MKSDIKFANFSTYQNTSKRILIFFNDYLQIFKMDYRFQPKNHSKQAVQTAQEILLKIISEITAPPIQIGNKDPGDLISNVYNQNYNIYQGKCYQQFSPNLCGYHAIFNTFCFLNIFNGGKSDYDIESGASFWKFKIKVEKFLFQMKRKYKLGEQWPWRQKDIRQGDFERTYNKICLQRFEEFSVFSRQQNFYYLSHTWSFQYQNLLFEHDSKLQLTQKFAQFREYKGKKPMVLHLMLGITTHWLTFLATKKNNKVQYWFIDSHNNHHLDYSWQQIVALIERKSEQRTKYGKPKFTNFQKQSYSMCIKDIQTSLKLIIDCLEGRRTLDSYIYNQKFHLFADPLRAAIAADHQSASIVIRQYQYNINSFFVERIQWNLLSETNNMIMKQIFQYTQKRKNHTQEIRFLYSLTKKQKSFL